jgi:uncharacterized metal-binding protein YceD (DUF177 family)
MIPPEFHRPERIDMIGEGPRTINIVANPAECAALATRFALIAVTRLRADFTVHREPSGILAHGRVRAEAVQGCVVTGDPVPVHIDEPVALRFVDHHDIGGDEIELSADVLDVIPYVDGAIDLGEAAAETMALALDPFPRSPHAETALRDAGVLREEEVGPFSGLAALKAKLGGNAA